MTLKDLIKHVDDIKPNAFSPEVKTAWVNEIEGMVQTKVLLISDVETVFSYDWKTDKNVTLAVDPPHDKLYAPYLMAKIDFANGEFDRYQNSMQMFNQFWNEFMCWFGDTYRPADIVRRVY